MKNTKKHFHKRLNVRIGIQFYNLLMTHTIYKENPKVVSCAYFFMNKVLDYNKKSAESSQMSSLVIKDLFKYYSSGNYKRFIDALGDLGLLIVVDSYCPKDKDVNGEGFCKKYKATKLAIELLSDSATEYYKRLETDKVLKRSVQKSISARKVLKKEYSDYVLNYIYDGLIHTSFDSKLALEMMEILKMNKAAKTLTVNHLIDFAEKNFKELGVAETNGRIYNIYAACKKEVRQCSFYKKDGLTLNRQYTIDIRACHPTFFSSYILTHVLPTTTHTPYCLPESGQVEAEHIKWVALFTNPLIDPRTIIMKWCKYKSIAYTKKALNETLNSSKTYKKVIAWLKTEFPSLYSVWIQSDIKQTGSMISKHYESAITLKESLYRYFDSLESIKNQYEYDGFSVYGEHDDKSLESKCHLIRDKMKEISMQMFGVPIISVIDPTTAKDDSIAFDDHVKDARHQTATYHALNDKLDALKTSRNRIARSIYKGGNYNKERHEQWKSIVSEQENLQKQLDDYLNNESLML